MKTSNVKVHIACGSYQFFEADLPEIVDMEELLALAEEFKKKELEARAKCPHFFYETYVSKAGQRYRQCFNCSALSFEEKPDVWSLWRQPVKRDG